MQHFPHGIEHKVKIYYSTSSVQHCVGDCAIKAGNRNKNI